MKVQILIICISVFLISCIEVRDPNKETKQNVVAPEQAVQPIAEVMPLSQPQKYAVRIKGLSDQSQITRKKLGVVSEKNPIYGVQGEDIVDSPGFYEYSIQQGDRKFQVQVEIPQDYIIEGDKDLKSYEVEKGFKVLKTAGRVFFRASSSLTTNGENFLIQAKSIESEGAMLQTFLPGQTVGVGFNGHHGGLIKIVAEELRGTLQVFMRGQNGGRGETLLGASRKKWQDINNNGGAGGNSGQLELTIKDQTRGQIMFNLEPGKGGEGTKLISHCLLKSCLPVVLKPKGENGRDGIAQQPIGLK